MGEKIRYLSFREFRGNTELEYAEAIPIRDDYLVYKFDIVKDCEYKNPPTWLLRRAIKAFKANGAVTVLPDAIYDPYLPVHKKWAMVIVDEARYFKTHEGILELAIGYMYRSRVGLPQYVCTCLCPAFQVIDVSTFEKDLRTVLRCQSCGKKWHIGW